MRSLMHTNWLNALYGTLNWFPPWQYSKSKVAIGSRDWVAYHEAGHVAAAIASGSRFFSSISILQLPGELPFGRTSVQGNKQVALGGFAVELALKKAGRLVDKSGAALSDADFKHESTQTTREDRVSFANHLGQPLSVALDALFDTEARQLANRLDFDLVERLARSLIVAGELNAHDLRRLIRRPASSGDN